jgi:transposase
MRPHRIPCAATARVNSIRSNGNIREWLEKDPRVSAAVIEQKLRSLGYQGGHSIVRQYVRGARPEPPKRAFVRREPLAGERFEVDWGHFGPLSYSGDPRKLYAFTLVDGHSLMLYVELTHSQGFGTFARCHTHAFDAMGGVAREIAFTITWPPPLSKTMAV